MRSLVFRASLVVAAGALAVGLVGTGMASRALAGQAPDNAKRTDRLTKGIWDYRAIGPLTFSQSGVLFFADDQAGAIYGVDLGEKASSAAAFAKIPDLGATLAARLGTTPTGIQIKDVALSPV